MLAEQGVHPILLDRDAEPRDQLCGGFLSWRTAEQLQRLGIDPAALNASRVGEIALFERHREFVAPLPSPAYGLSRRALDTAIEARAPPTAISEIDSRAFSNPTPPSEISSLYGLTGCQ